MTKKSSAVRNLLAAPANGWCTRPNTLKQHAFQQQELDHLRNYKAAALTT